MEIKKRYIFNHKHAKRRHMAVPSYNRPFEAKEFDNRALAVRYLNSKSTRPMCAEDWAIIGKLYPIN